jgi:hypothetical protein
LCDDSIFALESQCQIAIPTLQLALLPNHLPQRYLDALFLQLFLLAEWGVRPETRMGIEYASTTPSFVELSLKRMPTLA